MSDELKSVEHCDAELARLDTQIALELEMLRTAISRNAFTASQKLSAQVAKSQQQRNYVEACRVALAPKAPTNPDQVWAEFLNEVLPNLAPARLEELRRRVTEIIGEPLRLVYDADAERARNG